MAYFNRDNRGGGKKFNKGGFGGGDRGFNKPRPFMHKAICSSCGNECEVPFKPTGDRPVYCNNCFKRPGGEGQGNFQKPRVEQNSFGGGHNHDFKQHDGLKVQIEQLNSKLDKIIAALAVGSQTKPSVSVEKKEEVKKEKVAPAKTKSAPKKAKKKK